MALWSYNGCKIFLMVLVAVSPIYSRSPGLVRQSAYASDDDVLRGIVQCVPPFQKGPFNLKLVNISKCYDRSLPMEFDATCSGTKLECTRLLGNITIRNNVDGDIPATLSVNQFRNGEWKKDTIVMKFKKGFHACHDHLCEVYCSIFGDNVHPRKGVYKVDVVPIMAVSSVPVFPYGLWKGRMEAFNAANDVSFCTDLVLNVVPKKII